MIDRKHDLPISKQAEALNISRGSVYYLPRPVPKTELAIMHRLDRLHLEYPFAGSRASGLWQPYSKPPGITHQWPSRGNAGPSARDHRSAQRPRSPVDARPAA